MIVALIVVHVKIDELMMLKQSVSIFVIDGCCGFACHCIDSAPVASSYQCQRDPDSVCCPGGGQDARAFAVRGSQRTGSSTDCC